MMREGMNNDRGLIGLGNVARRSTDPLYVCRLLTLTKSSCGVCLRSLFILKTFVEWVAGSAVPSSSPYKN